LDVIIVILGFIIPSSLIYFALNYGSNLKIGKVEDAIFSKFFAEVDAREYYHKLNYHLKQSFESFQRTRLKVVFLSMFIFVIITLSFDLVHNYKILVVFVVVIFLIYKMFYLNLKGNWIAHIKASEEDFPYFIKTLAMLIGVHKNVQNAIHSSIEYAPHVFKQNIEILAQEMHDEPNNIEVFERFIYKYEGVKELSSLMKLMYRLSISNEGNEQLTASLTYRASTLVEQARREKNTKFNSMVSYLGLIPVFILGIALTMLMGFTM
jgi:hypothetical protein